MDSSFPGNGIVIKYDIVFVSVTPKQGTPNAKASRTGQ
jgi:hypothetical protein